MFYMHKCGEGSAPRVYSLILCDLMFFPQHKAAFKAIIIIILTTPINNINKPITVIVKETCESSITFPFLSIMIARALVWDVIYTTLNVGKFGIPKMSGNTRVNPLVAAI